jgi:predicted Rossmann fold nucleotide-binding protein DprA/Smf involved in DNA uptake
MIIAIVGSRSFTDYDTVKETIKEYVGTKRVDKIISGGAKGADKLAERFAKEHNIKIEVIYPRWKELGKKAGYIRNELIVMYSDLVFAFWDGESLGTAHTIRIAKRQGKKVVIKRM